MIFLSENQTGKKFAHGRNQALKFFPQAWPLPNNWYLAAFIVVAGRKGSGLRLGFGDKASAAALLRFRGSSRGAVCVLGDGAGREDG